MLCINQWGNYKKLLFIMSHRDVKTEYLRYIIPKAVSNPKKRKKKSTQEDDAVTWWRLLVIATRHRLIPDRPQFHYTLQRCSSFVAQVIQSPNRVCREQHMTKMHNHALRWPSSIMLCCAYTKTISLSLSLPHPPSLSLSLSLVVDRSNIVNVERLDTW